MHVCKQGAASLSKVLDMDPKNAEAKASLQMAQVHKYLDLYVHKYVCMHIKGRVQSLSTDGAGI